MCAMIPMLRILESGTVLGIEYLQSGQKGA
jgi:hypothetical protein